MTFLHEATAAIVLITLTLSFQSAGMASLIVWERAYFLRSTYRFGRFRSAELMVRFTTVMIALHILEILLWMAFYRWKCFPSWESAFYFSAASYSTVGYGDVLLPRTWRLLGPAESVTGVLMCGLSASLLFALVTRLVGHEARFVPALAEPVAELHRGV
jgi:voltage-gated potassium channel